MKLIFITLLYFVFEIANASPNTKQLTFSSQKKCFDVEFSQGASEVFSCVFPLEISYQIKNCETHELMERGKNQALLTCPDNQHWKMQFKDSQEVVSLNLEVNRESKGTFGTVASYQVKKIELSEALPMPTIIFPNEKQSSKAKEK